MVRPTCAKTDIKVNIHRTIIHGVLRCVSRIHLIALCVRAGSARPRWWGWWGRLLREWTWPRRNNQVHRALLECNLFVSNNIADTRHARCKTLFRLHIQRHQFISLGKCIHCIKDLHALSSDSCRRDTQTQREIEREFKQSFVCFRQMKRVLMQVGEMNGTKKRPRWSPFNLPNTFNRKWVTDWNCVNVDPLRRTYSLLGIDWRSRAKMNSPKTDTKFGRKTIKTIVDSRRSGKFVNKL